MRYWHNGKDEEYQRELERIRRFGGNFPSPMSHSETSSTLFLIGVQTALFLIIIAITVLGPSKK